MILMCYCARKQSGKIFMSTLFIWPQEFMYRHCTNTPISLYRTDSGGYYSSRSTYTWSKVTCPHCLAKGEPL